MTMMKAKAPYPFEPNSLGLPGPAKGDMVEVWFLPTANVERDGKQMVRLQLVASPILEWWAPVEVLELESDE